MKIIIISLALVAVFYIWNGRNSDTTSQIPVPVAPVDNSNESSEKYFEQSVIVKPNGAVSAAELQAALATAHEKAKEVFASFENSLEDLGILVLTCELNDPELLAVREQVLDQVQKQDEARKECELNDSVVEAVERWLTVAQGHPDVSASEYWQRQQELTRAKVETAESYRRWTNIISERDEMIIAMGHRAVERKNIGYAAACFTYVRYSEQDTMPLGANALAGLLRVLSEEMWRNLINTPVSIPIPPCNRPSSIRG